MSELAVLPVGRGVRDTSSWETGQRPKNPREGLTYLYPNKMPLTAMLGMLKSSKPPDAEYSFWAKRMPEQGGAITGIYTSLAGTPYSAAASPIGTILYVKVAAVTALEIKAGHTVLLRTVSGAAFYKKDLLCYVVEVVDNGASSYVVVKTLQTSVASPSNTTTVLEPQCAAATVILVVGSAHEENSVMPDPVNYNPVKVANYTQIFQTAYSWSGTQEAIDASLQVGGIKDDKREKFELHGFEMERAYIFGYPYETTKNGHPMRFTGGLLWAIRTYAPNNVFSFTMDEAAYNGKTWLEGGQDFFDDKFETINRWCTEDTITFVGSGAYTGITKLARAYGQYVLTPKTVEFGFQIQTLYIGGRKLNLMIHPLLSYQAANRYSMIGFNLKQMEEKVLRATKTIKRPEGEVDGKKEAWLTEAGLEIRNPLDFFYFEGIGQDNTNS